MPEPRTQTWSINGQVLEEGKTWDLGVINVSAEEIIAFAKVLDPLPFHTDPEAAARSHFRTLVAPGTMMYSEFHKKAFIPLFLPSIMAGTGILNWQFYKPHYPATDYFGTLTARTVDLNVQRGTVKVIWHFDFRDAEGHAAQELQSSIIHRLDPA